MYPLSSSLQKIQQYFDQFDAKYRGTCLIDYIGHLSSFMICLFFLLLHFDFYLCQIKVWIKGAQYRDRTRPPQRPDLLIATPSKTIWNKKTHNSMNMADKVFLFDPYWPKFRPSDSTTFAEKNILYRKLF